MAVNRVDDEVWVGPMGVLLAYVIMVLFVAMGFGSDVDEVLEALRHPVARGRHGSGELSVAALRARCQADTLPYYPAPTTAAGAATAPQRTAPAVLHGGR